MASLEEIRGERLKKLEAIKAQGKNAFPIVSNHTHYLEEVINEFDVLEKNQTKVILVGRILAKRGQGALTFFDLFDGTARFQAVAKKDVLGEESITFFQEVIDIGDFVEVEGTLFVTQKGEKTIEVKAWKILAKSLRSLPDKWHGLQDVEERFRKRYLDSLMSEEVFNRFVVRSKIITFLRSFLNKEGFLEVETSMLQALAGGATATPFVTHHEALDIDLNLRLAPELDLKKMLIGGFPKIYEIGRCFRNEGIDTTHNPEFTMLEGYVSFSEASKEMKRIERLIKDLVQDIFGKSGIVYNENEIDFSGDFKVESFINLVEKSAGLSGIMDMSEDELRTKAQALGLKLDPSYSKEKIIDHIYKKTCRPNIIQPTFLVDYPVAFAPLAKRREDNRELIDRFQLVVGGVELVNAFSELNDPLDQRDRFMEQEKNKAKGDNEAQPKDEEFIEAMEYGMPPACGFGLGIDRLVMLLTDVSNIKEVIYFPTLRPKGE